MSATLDSTESTAAAIITVRVPRDSETDLATEAERRLARIDGVSEVTVEGLRGLEPRLSATAATVAVTVDSTVPVAELRERLADATAIDAIESLDSDGT
jgi:hypothetical protein